MANGYIDPDRPNPNGPDDATIVIYGYTPHVALSALGVACFSIALAAHLLRTLKFRSWFTILLVIACFMELLGYIFRLLSWKVDPYRVSFFVAQYFLITTSPILITAVQYVCLARIQRQIASLSAAVKHSRFIQPRLILWLFIMADIITTIVQVTGAGLIGSTTSKHKDPSTPNDIVLAGIAIQTFFFVIYLTVLTWTMRHLQSIARDTATVERIYPILPFSIALWLSSVAVLVRLAFRLVETSQGVFGYLSSHEAFFGSLEFLPILMAMALLVWWHPGSALRSVRASDKTESSIHR